MNVGWTVRVRVSVMCRVLGSKASAGVFARHAANKLPLSSGGRGWGGEEGGEEEEEGAAGDDRYESSDEEE